PVLLEELAEVPPVDPGVLCCAGDVVLVPLVDGREVAALEAIDPTLLGLFEGEVRVRSLERGRVARRVDPEAQTAEVAAVTAAERPGPLEDVAELADVARPGVLEQ